MGIPTSEEYASRMRFLHSCFECYLKDSLKKCGNKFWHHRNAPKIITNAYYSLASAMREELSRDVTIPPGDDRKRIDRHKIAAGLLCTICAFQPIRLASDLHREIPYFNALFGIYVVGIFFEKWHKDRGLSFQITYCGNKFLSENLKWLSLHPDEIPHQFMAQTLYLFEMTCMLEKDALDRAGK